MHLYDLTLPTPEENLACDEALLEFCEATPGCEILRFWEPVEHFVVVGYANQVAKEVNQAFCRAERIRILRRCSGGGTVLQGPGCLNYSLILRAASAPALASISGTNEFILQRHQAALAKLLQAPVERQGHTDLAIGSLKFSGNAQRRKQQCLLFHGSFLLDLDITLVERALPMPSKEPGYRGHRSHMDFLMNLKVPVSSVKSALIEAWKADRLRMELPLAEISRLAREKYSSDEWNLKF